MKKLGILALIVLLAAVAFAWYRFGNSDADRIVVKLVPGPQQPKISPGEAGIDPAAIQLAVDYAGKRNTSALVIGRNGHIVFEKYWGDTTLDSSISTDHFAKVLGPLLVGSVMNDRLIRNLDEPISTYQPDLADLPDGSSGSSTLRQLLGSQADQGDEPAEIVARVLALVTKQHYEKLVSERPWKPMGSGAFRFGAMDRTNCGPMAPRRAAASPQESATGCASESCSPTMACSKATSSHRRDTSPSC